MNGISLSKCIKLILLIWLTNSKTIINSLELSCNIRTSEGHLNKTQNDVRPITAVNKCPNDYHDIDIIKKCEYFINSNKSENNHSLFIPVTNPFKNISYWNEFCAICNNETELEYWPMWTQLNNLDFVCEIYDLEVLFGSAVDDLDRITRNFLRHGLKLTSKLENSTELQCSMHENWPLNLLHHLVPCLIQQFRESQEKKFDTCDYVKSNGRVCTKIAVIIEGIDFALDKNNHALLLDKSLHEKFIQSGYIIQSGHKNVIYLCEESNKVREVFYWMENFVNLLSIILIVIYLFLNYTDKYLQSFPNKIIYSYAIGLLITHLLTTFVYLLYPLLFVVYLLSYSFLFTWTMIMSWEFCRLTYSTFRKRKVTISSQPKRYLIYCFVGYVIPAALLVIYFLILEPKEKRCAQLPQHFVVRSWPLEESVAWYFMEIFMYFFYGSLSIVIPIMFILQAGVLIYLTKCGPTKIRSTANRNHLIVLMKMGYIMGAQWMVNIFSESYIDMSNEPSKVITNVYMISSLFIDFQGAFVFFAFGFKKSWINSISFKFGCKKKSTRQNIGAGTRTNVKSISSSGNSNDSTGTNQ